MSREYSEVKNFWQEYQAAVLRQGIPRAKSEWYGRHSAWPASFSCIVTQSTSHTVSPGAGAEAGARRGGCAPRAIAQGCAAGASRQQPGRPRVPWDEVEWLVDDAEPVAPHRRHRGPRRDAPHGRGLLARLVHDLAPAERVQPGRHEAHRIPHVPSAGGCHRVLLPRGDSTNRPTCLQCSWACAECQYEVSAIIYHFHQY
jgi:hypothetical protein